MKTIGIDISVLSDKNKTGIAVYEYELLNELFKINTEDKFILFGIATLDTFNFLNNYPFKKYPNVRLKIFKMPSKFFRRAFLLWQKMELPKIESLIGKVDIFHSFNWFLPPQKSGKTIATVFDLTSINFADFHDQKTTQLDEIRLKRVSRMADLVITISENSKRDFLKFSDKSRVEVVYPGAADIFSPKIKKDELDKVLKKYKLSKNYMLSVSTLEPRKNLINLIKAYFKSGIKEPLVLVGKFGWKNDELLNYSKEKSGKLKFLGFVPDEDLPCLYKGAKALIYPSFYEGFGLPVLEAMKSGTCVITSKNSSLTEVGGDAVLYADPKNIEDLSKKMSMIANQKKLSERLSNAGIKQAQKFSWKKSAVKLNNFYQTL